MDPSPTEPVNNQYVFVRGLGERYSTTTLNGATIPSTQLSMTLAEHGGSRYDLIAVKFRGDTTRHETYTVHRETELVVRDASGATQTVQLFGSLLERDGQWKIFSYVVD